MTVTETRPRLPDVSAKPASSSPNELFRTHVVARRALAPGLIRLTVHCADLGDMAWNEVDQRSKLFLPKGTQLPDGYLAGLSEREWKAPWRAQDLEICPYLRTFGALNTWLLRRVDLEVALFAAA